MLSWIKHENCLYMWVSCVLSLQEGAALLAGEKLQDSRTKAKGKPSGPKRSSTIQKTMDEGVWFSLFVGNFP